jgi:hypothetical protein
VCGSSKHPDGGEPMSGIEQMARLAQCKDDEAGIQSFNELVFGSRLHDGQLRVATGSRKETNLISPGNSWGKTEFITREAVRYCWFKLVHGCAYTSPQEWLERDYRALICSYQFDIAKESFNRLLQRYDSGGGLLRTLVKRVIRSDPPKIEFANGAVLDFGSLDQGGRHVEGTRRQAIWVDEVGHIPDFRDAYRGILYPRTMGVKGIIWLLGTPKPHTDPWLFEMSLDAENPDSYYSFYEASSYENTYWPAEERERVERNPELFKSNGSLTEMGKQVVQGKFILAGGLFFNRAHVLRMFKGNHAFGLCAPGGVTAWDLAGSSKNSDATVGLTLDTSSAPWRVTRLEHLPGGSADWEEKYDLIEQCYLDDKPQVVGVDVTGPTGDSIAEELENRGLPVERIHFGGQSGKKYDMLRSLQSRMEMGGATVVSKDLVTRKDVRTVRSDADINGDDYTVSPFSGWIRFPDLTENPELSDRKKEFDFYKLEDKGQTTDTVMALAMANKLAVDTWLPPPMYGYVY